MNNGKSIKGVRQNIVSLITLLMLISCNPARNSNSPIIHSDSSLSSIGLTNDTAELTQYSEQQLELFLDSIGKLPSEPMMRKVNFVSDSIFKNQLQINKTLTKSEFNTLKDAIKKNEMDNKTAFNIFGEINIDSSFLENGVVPISFFSFDKNKSDFNEYAICIGYPDDAWSCDLYFFKSNKIIAKHTIYHRYGLELKHYKDIDGKTVVYYKENYQSGSGIWWYNFNFYKYYDNTLIPILNELENANLQYPWSTRVLYLESFVKKTNPLTLKMVYYQAFSDTTISRRFIDDSTIVQYNWDEKSKTLVGNYKKSKISKGQILSYYLEDNELLFMNVYYKTVRENLLNKEMRQSTLNYLNKAKNFYDKKHRF